MSIKRCTRAQLQTEFFPAAPGSASSKQFLEDWKPIYCFDHEFLGDETYPSIYGDPTNRHNDFKQVFFEVGPCLGSQCDNLTATQREAELAKLEFILIYNNERLNLQSRSTDLHVTESIVKTFKINPKAGPIQFNSEVT